MARCEFDYIDWAEDTAVYDFMVDNLLEDPCLIYYDTGCARCKHGAARILTENGIYCGVTISDVINYYSTDYVDSTYTVDDSGAEVCTINGNTVDCYGCLMAQYYVDQGDFDASEIANFMQVYQFNN